MSDELKPCSCGSTDTSICYESPQGYWVECGDCGRQTEKIHGRDLAIAAWIRRAQPAEAEGVEVVGVIDEADEGCFVELMHDRTLRLGEKLVRQSDHLATLSAVTAERDRLRAENSSARDAIVAMAANCDQLRADVETLRALLNKALPVVEAHAGASHMLEGFRPTRNKWDELVDGIRAALSTQGGVGDE